MIKIDGSMLNLFIFIIDIIEISKYSNIVVGSDIALEEK